MVALCLSRSTDREPIALNAHVFESHFPLLRHLVLKNAAHNAADIAAFAWNFPSIGRLPLAPGRNARLSLHNLDHILGIVTDDNVPSGLLWPRLESIVLGASGEQPDVPQLISAILRLQARKLLLPAEVHAAMAEVGEIIEIEEYCIDWPTLFDD